MERVGETGPRSIDTPRLGRLSGTDTCLCDLDTWDAAVDTHKSVIQ